jgi:isopropylmalate/homocitrate/citramalate synthase
MASAKIRWCGRFGIEIGYPSKIKMARSLGAAAVKHTVAGMPKRSPDQIAAAMKICRACPSYISGDERCTKCGCKMPRKIKWATTKCPLKKW